MAGDKCQVAGGRWKVAGSRDDGVFREELRAARQEEDRAAATCQRLRTKVATLEAQVKAGRGAGGLEPVPVQVGGEGSGGEGAPQATLPPPVAPLPPTLSPAGAEAAARLEGQLVAVLDELAERESGGRRLEAQVASLGGKLAAARHQLGLLYAEHGRRAESWAAERATLEAGREAVEQEAAAARARVEEYEAHLEALAGGEEEAGRRVAESARRVALLRANEAVLSRRYQVVEARHAEARGLVETLRTEVGRATTIPYHTIPFNASPYNT